MTNDETIYTRILCSRPRRPHTIGTVVGTRDGLKIRYTAAMGGRDGDTGTPCVWREREAAEGTVARCEACRKTLLFSLSEAVTAARAGRRAVTLVTEAYARDPVAILNRRAVGSDTV